MLRFTLLRRSAAFQERARMAQFELVPQAARPAQGAEGDKRLGKTGGNFSSLGTAPCYRGPNLNSTESYICVTCAAFARFGGQVAVRNNDRRCGSGGAQ